MIFSSSARILIAFSLALCISAALSPSCSTSVDACSIIFPITITFSVADWVSCACDDAPSAIPVIAVSTCPAAVDDSFALFFNASAASPKLSLYARISAITFTIIFFNSVIDLNITPTSSFLLSIFLSEETSSLKSRFPSFSTVSVALIIGATIFLVTNIAAIRHKTIAKILPFTVDVTIEVVPDNACFLFAFTTRIKSLLLPT